MEKSEEGKEKSEEIEGIHDDLRDAKNDFSVPVTREIS